MKISFLPFLLGACFALTACDSPDQTDIYPYPSPGPSAPHTTVSTTPTVVPGDTFASIQAPLLQKWCSACHSGEAFLTSGSAFTASNGNDPNRPQGRVLSKVMPVVGSAQAVQMPQADRDTLTNYRSPN